MSTSSVGLSTSDLFVVFAAAAAVVLFCDRFAFPRINRAFDQKFDREMAKWENTRRASFTSSQRPKDQAVLSSDSEPPSPG